jgi:DnaJ-class molecular chaperone
MGIVGNKGFKLCDTCNGTGIEELHHGLVQRKCPKCEGKGKIKVRVKMSI